MRTGVRGDTETIAIRLPKSIVVAIDEAVTDLGTSRGNFLACMILERMEIRTRSKNHDAWCAENLPHIKKET